MQGGQIGSRQQDISRMASHESQIRQAALPGTANLRIGMMLRQSKKKTKGGINRDGQDIQDCTKRQKSRNTEWTKPVRRPAFPGLNPKRWRQPLRKNMNGVAIPKITLYS